MKRHDQDQSEQAKTGSPERDAGQVVDAPMDLVRQFPSRGGPLPTTDHSRWRKAVNMPHIREGQSG